MGWQQSADGRIQIDSSNRLFIGSFSISLSSKPLQALCSSCISLPGSPHWPRSLSDSTIRIGLSKWIHERLATNWGTKLKWQNRNCDLFVTFNNIPGDWACVLNWELLITGQSPVSGRYLPAFALIEFCVFRVTFSLSKWALWNSQRHRSNTAVRILSSRQNSFSDYSNIPIQNFRSAHEFLSTHILWFTLMNAIKFAEHRRALLQLDAVGWIYRDQYISIEIRTMNTVRCTSSRRYQKGRLL